MQAAASAVDELEGLPTGRAGDADLGLKSSVVAGAGLDRKVGY